MYSETKIKKQVQKVIDLVLEKKNRVNREDHNYLNTLLRRLKRVDELLNSNEDKKILKNKLL
ncbi:hypothetical protein ACUUYQ_09085 [Bacillus halotolerans]|uniref:hypothetical protein n=1 Tax=Bacillus TaxID=1386 RepID=UPI000FDAAC3D|nr:MULTISPECIES: hypothetical protein [Bacillus]AZV49531.1 hypothetical protein DIC78_11300 [Bacillus halotolerans]MBL3647535.1 hypothetical protein [Bacillus sp. RHFS10]MEC3637487.1 hypothetical protein [Bacillus halotolerans]QDK67332.1 hypothetical protein FLQ13_06810 [Bacillus halotolerans]UTL76588.1 hypothetical protein NLW79_21010 [Bacillus halotolerans]